MSAGKQSSADVTVTYDDAPGGSGVAIQNFLMELGGAKIIVGQETSTAFGDAWKESVPTGVRESPDIAVSGFFDTTPAAGSPPTGGGPHVVLRVVDGDADPNGSTRTLAIVFGDSKTFTVETRLVDYEVAGQNGTLTKFNATIRPTGQAVWS